LSEERIERMTDDILIRWGCDLGTTNSCIARKDHQGTTIARSNDYEDITPSAVYRKSVGGKMVTYVGKRARDRLVTENLHVAVEFKTNMGLKDWVFQFPDITPANTAEELSAEVLKEVLGSAARDDGGPLKAAVISVPMAFLQPSCDATKRAAEAAGLKYVELVKEPIAAALAYGMTTGKDRTSIWLVYDLGGGTFDAALMKYEDRIPSVVKKGDFVAAGGDRNLGGKNLDAAIVEQVFARQIPAELAVGLKPYESLEWYILKECAETAKRRLSTSSEYHDFCMLSGQEVDLSLSRAELDRLEEQVFGRTIVICRELIDKAGYSGGGIDKVILVGGSTLSPHIRQMIDEGLGLEIDYSIDPLTAVAKGASIYASMREIPEEFLDEPDTDDDATGEILVNWKSQRATNSLDTVVSGKLEAREGTPPPWEGWTLELQQVDVNKNPIKVLGETSPEENGSFAFLVSISPGQNHLLLKARDAEGGVLMLGKASWTVTYLEDVPPPVALERAIGIVGPDGEVDPVFPAGTTLPAKTTLQRVTTRVLKRGSHDPLRIPLVEGNEGKARLNWPIQTLEIEGVSEDIPELTLVEIFVDLDCSRTLKVTAVIPDFEIIKVSAEHVPQMDLQPDKLEDKLSELKDDLSNMRKAAGLDAEIKATVAEVDSSGGVAEIEKLFGSVTSRNPAPGQQGYERLLDVLKYIDPYLDRTDDAIYFMDWKEEYTDKNINASRAIVVELSAELPDDWKSKYRDLIARYDSAVAAMDRDATENIAYVELVTLFKAHPTTAARINAEGGPIDRPIRKSRYKKAGDTMKG